MTTAALTDDQIRATGQRGIEEVVARSEAPKGAGLDIHPVAAWLEGAGTAFSLEMKVGVSLLQAARPSCRPHGRQRLDLTSPFLADGAFHHPVPAR
jgi:hypothetical protein